MSWDMVKAEGGVSDLTVTLGPWLYLFSPRGHRASRDLSGAPGNKAFANVTGLIGWWP